VSRGYAWPQAMARTPDDFRFGCRTTPEPRGVRAALFGGAWAAEGEEDSGLKTKLASARVEAYRETCLNNAPLGARPAPRQGEPPTPPGFAFGVPSRGRRELEEGGGSSVGELLRCCSSPAQLEPDPDLGRCIREGRRNITTETRAFGRPSRPPPSPALAFQPPPRQRPATALAGTPSTVEQPLAEQRLWAEDSAAAAMAPDVACIKGVDRSEFARPRGRAEVRSLLEAAGYRLRSRSFDELWHRAAQEYHLALATPHNARGGGSGCSRMEEVEIPLSVVIESYIGSRLCVPHLAVGGA